MTLQHDKLAAEMRACEDAAKTTLDFDMPYIIRVDGNAFKHFTKGLKVPFDAVFRKAMADTMLDLCASVPGTLLGYTFSDEISLLVCPDMQTESRWFANNVQKIASISASLATSCFNRRFAKGVERLRISLLEDMETPPAERFKEYPSSYLAVLDSRCGAAIFDSRAFSLPYAQLMDYLLFRQSDCIRNSVPAVARAWLDIPKSDWTGKSVWDMRQMLRAAGHPWEEYPDSLKYGLFAAKFEHQFERELNGETITFTRGKWELVPASPDLAQDPKGLDPFLPAI